MGDAASRPLASVHGHSGLGPQPAGLGAIFSVGLFFLSFRRLISLQVVSFRFNSLDNLEKLPSILFETVFSRDRLRRV
jgi:hypothetical protein